MSAEATPAFDVVRASIEERARLQGIKTKVGNNLFHASTGQKKIVVIDVLNLAEGIRYAKQEEIHSINIVNPSHAKAIIDFSVLEDFHALEVLFFNFDVPKSRITNIDALYELNLKKLVFQKFDAHIDYGRLHSLEYLVVQITKHNTVESLPPSLKKLTIQGWKDSDFTRLPPSTNIELLIVKLSRLESLDGIERLSHLTDLRIYGCHHLQDLEAVNNLRETLVNLELEACSKITSEHLSALKLDRLQHLSTLLALENIHFVQNFPALERMSFRSVTDGDLNSIIKHPSLKGVGFSPSKRHYSHTSEELNALIDKPVSSENDPPTSSSHS